jgi:cyclopropane-fatty-acyl-phospholipid synthase
MLVHRSERSLGEAYVRGDLDIEGDLESALSIADYFRDVRFGLQEKARLVSHLVRLPSGGMPASGRRAVQLVGEIHSLERDRQAVTYHYDTSNEFFSLFLDRDMVYSCAYFAAPDEELEHAQERKMDYLCRKLRLKPGQRLLDIGCGWGGLIRFAARHFGVSALGVTLSEPQASLASQRILADGLSDRCRAEVRDYRKIADLESFDAIVSVGMVEHVGQRRLPEYFRQAWKLLRPGGVFLNHGIARRQSIPSGQKGSFTEAYVFPDTDPVPIAACTHAAEEAGFEIRDIEDLREHYALTLRHWARRLERNREQAIRATDEVTFRTWKLFMTGSARAFERGVNNVYQSLMVKTAGGRSGLPLTRSDWYT